MPCKGDDQVLSFHQALTRASMFKGEHVIIKLEPATYNLHRSNTPQRKYHISNTTSEYENPDPTKHIGIWIKDMENITIDGNGATILTYGEITPFVIDNCKNIKITNLKVNAADPSVVEITIKDVGDHSMVFEVLKPTNVNVSNDFFYFKGEGWIFGDEKRLSNHTAIAQIYDPVRKQTLRTPSPIGGYTKAEMVDSNTIRLLFNHQPEVRKGERYQLRHSIRNEAAMFINRSKDVEIQSVDFQFMGNFGAVSQFSENVTFDRVRCMPDPESGRTNAGFADFLQFSSCKGLIKITNSDFAGSHDDPINIHGTHLAITKSDAPNTITVTYRHPQTFGFLPFIKGDEVGFVDRNTLNYVGEPAVVDSIISIDDYNYNLILNKDISFLESKDNISDYAVENLTWIPDVLIKDNNFSRTPTRAILITTKGKSVIENNLFYRIPMASILVADDARSWYESGPVSDLTIRKNVFVDCASPVIYIAPEVREYNAPVHTNISIVKNKFFDAKPNAINVRASDHILIKNNLFTVEPMQKLTDEEIVTLENVPNYKIEDNKIRSMIKY